VAEKIGLAPESIDQLIYFQLKPDLAATLKDGSSILKRGTLIVKARTPIDVLKIRLGLRGQDETARCSVSSLDPQTAMIGEEATLKYVESHAPAPGSRYAWSEAWSGVERNQVAIAFDVACARALAEPFLMEGGMAEVTLFASPLAPI